MKVSKIFSLIFALMLFANSAICSDSQSANTISVSEEIHQANVDVLKDYIIKFHAKGGAYIVLNTTNNGLVDKQFIELNDDFPVWSHSVMRLFHYAIGMHTGKIKDDENIDLYAKDSELFEQIAKTDRKAYLNPYMVGDYATPMNLLLAYIKVFKNADNYLTGQQLAILKSAISDNVKSGKAKQANVEEHNVSGLTCTTFKDKSGKKVYTTFVGNFEANGQNYAIITLLDEPEALKETYGFKTSGWNSSPMAAEIIKNIGKGEKK